MLLVHAGVFDAWFEPPAELLPGRTTRMLRAGCTGGPPPPGPVEVAEHVRHVAAVLDALDAGPAPRVHLLRSKQQWWHSRWPPPGTGSVRWDRDRPLPTADARSTVVRAVRVGPQVDRMDGMAASAPSSGEPRWRLIQEAVGRVVDAQDPEGLLAMGCPADEYESEVQALAGLVVRGPVTSAEVLRIWEHWFGPGSSLMRSPARLDRLTGELVEVRRRQVLGGRTG